MNNDHRDLPSSVGSDYRAIHEEAIRHLKEKYPAPSTPLRHEAQNDEYWGLRTYAASAI